VLRRPSEPAGMAVWTFSSWLQKTVRRDGSPDYAAPRPRRALQRGAPRMALTWNMVPTPANPCRYGSSELTHPMRTLERHIKLWTNRRRRYKSSARESTCVTFVDLDCGKRRTLSVATSPRFKQVISVKFLHELAEIARKESRTDGKSQCRCRETRCRLISLPEWRHGCLSV